jgi:sugar phosphate isomerase/epimerase
MTSQVLARCGLSEIATPTQTLADDVRTYAAAGFGAIGIWIHKLERDRIDEFWIPQERIPHDVVEAAVAAVRSSGLRVSHLVLTGFFTGPGTYEDAVEHTLHAMDVATAFDADCLIVAPGRRNGRTYEETQAVAARALSEVFERTTQRELRLALEPIVPWQSDYLNTLAEALDLVDLVDHPNLGVYPDTYHLWRTETLMEDIERAGDRIFGVHLNDWDPEDDHSRPLPGEGVIPLVDVVRAIEATGYRRTYDSEFTYDPALIESSPDEFAPDVVVARCASAMSGLLEKALAAGSREVVEPDSDERRSFGATR